MSPSVVPGPPPEPSPEQRAALIQLAGAAAKLPRRRWAPVVGALSEWSMIGACVAVSVTWPWTWLPCAILVGCRQHGLLVLMHEAVHGHFHADRRINDLVSNVLCAWPFGTSTAAYRSSHLAHHRALHTERDPDWIMRHDLPEWDFPMAPGRLLWTVGTLALGRGVVAFFRSNRRMAAVTDGVLSAPEGRFAWVPRAAVWTGAVGLSYAAGGLQWFVALWVMPILVVLPVLVRIRVMAEHYGSTSDSVFSASRDWSGGPLLDWLLVPWSIRMHRTHHLFPGVPFHQLESVGRLLRADPVVGASCPRQSLGQLWRDLTESSCSTPRCERTP